MEEIIGTLKKTAEVGGHYDTTKSTAVTSVAVRMNRTNRRYLIEQAAIHLFAKYGFRGTTTREIAVQAGVSEGSLF